MTLPQPPGFLALPPSGQGPGVLVLHAWWGLNETMKSFCGRLAAKGFVAFAPDFYDGRIADTVEGARKLAGGLDEAKANAVIAGGVDFLSDRADKTGDGLGVVAFSLGVWFALGLSVEDPDRVRRVVVFYGTRDGDYGRSKASYLCHFAETDDFEPASSVRSMEDSIRAAGRPVAVHTYEGTGHWFLEPDRPDAYNEPAAKLAWERTAAFLGASPDR
ncbi:MAG TPA: dienelactone hydrolase family protein [Candidatus Eisenbacteria bacterium]|nr:dienelactone hydrolase family protein [Candidatus Eisenbacteria bacterium]